MTEQQQPEALHLAGMNEAATHGYPAATVGYQLHTDTAAELRRLHAENLQLRAALEQQTSGHDKTLDELRISEQDVRRLRKAVVKLHAAKGRYHTQLAACDLYDLLGLKNERPTK